MPCLGAYGLGGPSDYKSRAQSDTQLCSHDGVQLKALVNIVVDRLKKKIRTVLADLYNYVQVDE